MNKSFLTLLMILLLLLVIVVLFVFDPIYNEPIYSYQALKPKFKTGDILLFSCKKHGSVLEKLIYAMRTNIFESEYGHAGLIIRDGEKLYLAECCDADQVGFQYAKYLNDQGRGGVRIIDLDIVLEKYYYEYQGVCSVKFISKEIPLSTMMKNILKYHNRIFQDKKIIGLLAITDIFLFHPLAVKMAEFRQDGRMICTEFVYTVLYDCGVMGYYPAKLFWPHSITNGLLDKLAVVPFSKHFKLSITDDQKNDNHDQNQNNMNILNNKLDQSGNWSP